MIKTYSYSIKNNYWIEYYEENILLDLSFNKTPFKEMRLFYIYILTNKRHGTLYIGITSNLERRIFEHKNSQIDGFTKKYDLKMLVYFDESDDIAAAIQKEKQMKKWNRSWKIALIEKHNPQWVDLAKNWF